MVKDSISEEDIKTILSGFFSNDQLNRPISFNSFIHYLKKINSYQPIEEDLFEQIYEKMADHTSPKTPSMTSFPQTYLQALVKLDSKIHKRATNIANVDETLSRIKIDLQKLHDQKKEGKLIEKLEVNIKTYI